MEGILDYKITPLLKCMLLLLFIFTAKVLTSRPQESQETRSSIHYEKPYLRTFTKYHHRRTIHWNEVTDSNSANKIEKRSIDESYFTDDSESFFYSPSSEPNNITPPKKIFSENNLDKNHLSEIKKYKVKAAIVVTDPPTTSGPKISCLYKIKSVVLSPTPAEDDERNAQQVVENEDFG